MDGVGYVLAGRWGRELFSIAYPMFMIFLSGSGFVAISIAFNAITTHATCTVVWVVVVSDSNLPELITRPWSVLSQWHPSKR
jgi:hypothetical protein